MNESQKAPKYSILIPTRNRLEFLPFAIDSVLSQGRDDVELVISDNYSKDGTSTYLKAIAGKMLRVIKPPAELSMSGHYEFILTQAKGDWVTILGDDDAIMPNLFKRLDLIIEQYSDNLIISSKRAYYFWEGCEDISKGTVLSYRTGPGVKIRSTRFDLLCALTGLRSCFDMPQIYTTCVVKKSLIDEIKEKSSGYFYYSIIPDMYSVIALSLTANKYVRVEEPLFWVGTSNKSMGRSDRIYRDSEMQMNKNQFENQAIRILKLNPNISYDLHSAGFSSFYLYEALKQCPFKKSEWNNKLLSSVVYASLKLSLEKWTLNGKADNRTDLINTINMEMKKNRISSFVVFFCLFFLRGIKLGFLTSLFFSRILHKVKGYFKINAIHSKDRNRFPNIKMASKEVLSLKLNI